MSQTDGPRGYRGGRLRETKWRGIAANPNGNREQRRAARKLRARPVDIAAAIAGAGRPPAVPDTAEGAEPAR